VHLPDITILHIIYQQNAYEGHAKNYEFSGTSMREHWMSGYEETKRTLKHKKRSGCRCLCTALASWFTTSIAMRIE